MTIVQGNESKAETTLKVISSIILIFGIIFTFGSLIYAAVEEEGSIALIGLGVLFASIITWAFFRVICNISDNLKQLNETAFDILKKSIKQ